MARRGLLAAVLVGVALLFPRSGRAQTDDLYLIDAHSQATVDTDLATIVPLMDRGGVYRTILSRIPKPPATIAQMMSITALAKEYPDRIVPAVSTKIGRGAEYDALLRQQVDSGQFRAMAEILIYHAAKPGYPRQVIVPPGDPRVQTAIRYAMRQGWPSVMHIEFGAIPRATTQQKFMKDFEAVLKAHPDHPFVLPDMGQLPAEEVLRLIEGHANIYFTTAHTTPGTERVMPFSHLFADRTLAPEWKRLFVQHPDRFVFSLDVIDPRGWMPQVYLRQVGWWRSALADLPPELARAVAHGNAERLWKLQPKPP